MAGVRLSKREMLTFASGDMFGGGAQLIISFYYLIFLTDVVRIRPALAGVVILCSKIWDAVSDPLMGLITDNTNTRWGRRRPYFLIGFFSILASFFLLWYPISHDSTAVKFFYVLFAYLLYSTVSTLVMVPYAAMSSEISRDYTERNTVNGTRLVFSQVSSLLCAVVPIEIVKLFPDARAGYMAMALSFGAFFAVPFLLIFLFTQERVQSKEQRTGLDLRFFPKPFQIRSFRLLILIYLTAFLAMDIVSTVFAYYMQYYLRRPGELNYVLGAMLITQVAMIPLVVKTANAFGKAKTVMGSICIWALGVGVLSLQQPHWPFWAIYANAVLMGMGVIGCIVMPWLMYPDVTDVGQLAFGKRSAGSFSGIMTFMRKFSSAVGIFVVSFILDLSGYIKPEAVTVDGVTRKVLMEQPDAVITALKWIVTGLPFLLLFMTFLAARRYPIDHKTYAQLSAALEHQEGVNDAPPLTEAELCRLKQTLI